MSETVTLQELLNLENGFNIHTNAFTCTRAGLYLFIFFIGNDEDGARMEAYLEVNRQHQIDVALQPEVGANELQGGNALLTRLGSGDVVIVRSSANNEAQGSSTLRTTTFTGLFVRD